MKKWRLTLQSTVVNFCRKSCVSLKIKYPIIVRQYTDVIDSSLLLLRKPNTTAGAFATRGSSYSGSSYSGSSYRGFSYTGSSGRGSSGRASSCWA